MSINKQIIKELTMADLHDFRDVDKIKHSVLRAAKGKQPTKSELLKTYREMLDSGEVEKSAVIERLLQRGHIRSLSGVSVITVLTKPYACPGKCVYCPTESIMPKSYLSNEPAAQRALRNKFDPWLQISNRICMLEGNGHAVDKVEMIVKGGTWNAYRYDYQLWFIRRCYEACNRYGTSDANLPDERADFKMKEIDPETTFTNVNSLEVIDAPNATTSDEIQKSIEIEKQKLAEAIKINEMAKYRIIGLTLETRPDWIRPEEVARMREMGCTRVEVGLQHTDDEVLKLIKRGHTVQQFKDGISLLRDAGFKVDLHTMPHLPGATPESDIKMYDILFDDPGLRPDMIKIYPCTVVPLSELQDWYDEGKFTPYPIEDLYRVLKEAKKRVPKYCRISRLIRDIPSDSITAGNKVTNLREMLQKDMEADGETCVCLRCREYGRSSKKYDDLLKEEPQLFIEKFIAGNGTEYFLSYEDPQRRCVFAFLRLRLPSSQDEKILELMPEIKDCAFVRELHTYGHLVKIDAEASDSDVQHKGFGKKLMKEAENIATEKGFKTMAVISGVGVRQYYEKLGYHPGETYMLKNLSS